MGEVYRARDQRLGREVAIKVLPASLVKDPDRQHRFEQEALALFRVSLADDPEICAFNYWRYLSTLFVIEGAR